LNKATLCIVLVIFIAGCTARNFKEAIYEISRDENRENCIRDSEITSIRCFENGNKSYDSYLAERQAAIESIRQEKEKKNKQSDNPKK